MHLLRNYVGDEAFFEAVGRYVNRYAFQTVEVHNLRLVFEEVTGEDLNWFFDQWFLSAGHPELKVEHYYINDTLYLNTAQLQDSENPRNYEDAVIIRVGGQYMVNEALLVRAGFYYDQSPITDEFFNPETPNSDNLGFTAGLSYNITDKLGVDASFLYIAGLERESELLKQRQNELAQQLEQSRGSENQLQNELKNTQKEPEKI